MDASRFPSFTQRRFGWMVVLTVVINAAIVVGIGWFVWKLVAMATGH